MAPRARPPGLRKGMRKGTHSCYECRRRKVRCIFAVDSTICEGCAARGRACTEQRRELVQAAGLDTRETLRDQVARLEATIRASSSDSSSVAVYQASSRSRVDARNAQPDGAKSQSSSSASDPTPASMPSPNSPASAVKDSALNIDPIVTLFDNAIWRRHSYDLAQERISKSDETADPGATTKRLRTCELLLSDIMSPELHEMIMNATCSWWHTWRPLGPWLSTSVDDSKTSTLPDFVLWALDSSNPSIVGLAMLCIAICIQQLDPRVHQYIIRQLPRLPGALFQEYFEKVNFLIISDSDFAGTEEGIAAMMLSAKIYMNLGLNRKCWLLLHQAISHGQLLGLHRPERLSARETDKERHRRTQSWLLLCSADVYTSLLLGLPYAADGRTIPVAQSQHTVVSLLQHNLILLSAEVIDRNQRGLSLSVSRTEEIQKQVDAVTKDVDETFWNPSAALAGDRITRDEYLELLACQCWLYQLQVLLNMPLMIQSVEEAHFEKHRIACLDASRNFLKTYHVMRSDPFAAFGMVKLIDFQAFVCSTLLVLGLLGYGGFIHHAAYQTKDRDLIALTVATLRQACGTTNNSTAMQAAQGLETLMSLDQSECPRTAGTRHVNPYMRIAVPYAGIITISPGVFYSNLRPVTPSPEDHHRLTFSLSNDMFQETSASVNQPPALYSNTSTRFDGGQAGVLEFWDDMNPELASIDLDRASALPPNFEDDWAWLNDLNY